METAKPCGHRLYDRHFKTIRRASRFWKMSEAEALRKIIDLVELRRKLNEKTHL